MSRDKLKPYIAGFKDADWICIVLAYYPGQAKSIFWKDGRYCK